MSLPSHSRIILSEVSRATPQSDVSTNCSVSMAFRCFEIVVAATALLLCAPILAIIAIIVRTGTPGPSLFVQDRLGLNGKPFRFVKFRTLYADAKQRFPSLYTYKYSQQELLDLKFKASGDPRITRQGAWLRQSSFDELPNFWNVLTGDMALVGPRPEIPEMLPYYEGEMLRKFSVRPGITGLAQTSGRGRLGFYETVAFDLQYVDKRSISSDLKIILKTIRMVFLRDGAF
jgi:exopolysaccharide production protein ExoY